MSQLVDVGFFGIEGRSQLGALRCVIVNVSSEVTKGTPTQVPNRSVQGATCKTFKSCYQCLNYGINANKSY